MAGLNMPLLRALRTLGGRERHPASLVIQEWMERIPRHDPGGANSRSRGVALKTGRAAEPRRGELFANGLDLWSKPFIRLFPCWSRLGAFGPDLFDPAQRLPELSQPGVLVLAGQPDAPARRIPAAGAPPGAHQRVEPPPLGLAEPGHHRHRQCGEHHLPVVTDDAPGDLPAECVFCLAGDLDPGLTGLLTEPAGTAVRRRGAFRFR